MDLVVRHEFDGGVREDADQGGRVTLEESADSSLGVDVSACSEDTSPCSCHACIGKAVSPDPQNQGKPRDDDDE
jgi:hypothetical protein